MYVKKLNFWKINFQKFLLKLFWVTKIREAGKIFGILFFNILFDLEDFFLQKSSTKYIHYCHAFLILDNPRIFFLDGKSRPFTNFVIFESIDLDLENYELRFSWNFDWLISNSFRTLFYHCFEHILTFLRHK